MKEYRDASNRLTIEFAKIKVSKYSNLTKIIVKKFDLKPLSLKVTGLDEIFQDFILDNKKVALEWNIWSGYSIYSKNINAESLVLKIGNFVKYEIED